MENTPHPKRKSFELASCSWPHIVAVKTPRVSALIPSSEAMPAPSGEVVNTHAKLSGEGEKNYVEKYFPRTWAHFDVNGSGMVGVEVMPQFMRFILSNQSVQYD